MKTAYFSRFLSGQLMASYVVACLLAAVTSLSGCSKKDPEPASPANPTPSEQEIDLAPAKRYSVPDTLRVPTNAVLLSSIFGVGVQIYEVRATAADPSKYEWAFVAPEATLYGTDNFVVGKHFGGPTWEGNDGSTVVGQLVSRFDAPAKAFNIPWLLLKNRSNTGSGVFSSVKYIQRLNTRGGQAPPAQTATKETLGKRVRIPYLATYTFYGVK